VGAVVFRGMASKRGIELGQTVGRFVEGEDRQEGGEWVFRAAGCGSESH